jgi:uncharacterized protein (TIGR02147 family)
MKDDTLQYSAGIPVRIVDFFATHFPHLTRASSALQIYHKLVNRVFDYLDYRDMLKDAYEDGKATDPLFSYRTMAKRLGTDASYLFRILRKELHLPVRCVPETLEFLGLSGRAAEYFQLLLACARSRGKLERQEILEKAATLRDVERRHLGKGEQAFFRDWWVSGVRCLLEVVDGRSRPEDLAARFRPGVTAAEIQSALETLLELGFAKKGPSGRLLLTEPHITAGGDEKVVAVRHFQKQVLDLAKESLERFPPELRDVSTLTLAVDKEAFEDIRALLRECRRQIQKRVEAAPHPDRVLELSMAIFPIAPPPEKADRN